jgi:hypothetical protein
MESYCIPCKCGIPGTGEDLPHFAKLSFGTIDVAGLCKASYVQDGHELVLHDHPCLLLKAAFLTIVHKCPCKPLYFLPAKAFR